MNTSNSKLISHIKDYIKKEGQSILARERFIVEDFLSVLEKLNSIKGKIIISDIGT